jgi:hypothetical protein
MLLGDLVVVIDTYKQVNRQKKLKLLTTAAQLTQTARAEPSLDGERLRHWESKYAERKGNMVHVLDTYIFAPVTCGETGKTP